MRRVVCIGGANADRKVKLKHTVQWHTSNPARTTFASGGVARNIAENLARLHCAVSLITVWGDDSDGEELRREMDALGIDYQHSWTLSGQRTGSYISVIDPHGEMVLATADMGIYANLSPERLAGIGDALTLADWVFLDTNIPSNSINWLIQKAAHSSIKLCLDPVSVPKTAKLPQQLRGLEIIFPNIQEAEALSQISWEGKHSCKKIQKALMARGVSKLVLSLGKEGVFAATEEETQFLPAPPVSVKDVTGAGDALAAAVIWGLQKGYSFFDACALGVQNAELTLQTEETVSSQLSPELLLLAHSG